MGFTTGNGGMNLSVRAIGSSATLLISEQRRTVQEKHLITAAKPDHSVSMGTGYYVLAPRKQEVYVCLQAVFTMPPWCPWPGYHPGGIYCTPIIGLYCSYGLKM